jgi:WD40 repeat protein
MKTKFELESVRVKGVCFHPSRPWILYSTHSGTVHIHDYDIGVELQRYSVTKDLPVRCVSFHPTQPLFACGTDNYDVVIYDWQRKMKLSHYKVISFWFDPLNSTRITRVRFNTSRSLIATACMMRHPG